MPSSVLKTGASPEFPKVKISSRGAKRIKDGHVWVYRSDIVAADGVAPGAVVQVSDERGKFLGTAFYSTASQIAIRMISGEMVKDVNELLRERVRAAVEYRQRFVSDTDDYRVVFSEADFLEGLMVDRCNGFLSVQVFTQASEAVAVRNTVIADIAEE